MPREDRRIFFEYDEAYRAVYSLCGQKGVEKPPAGYLQKVEPNHDSPLELDLFIESHKTGSIENVTYTKDFVVAALIIMCRGIGIPLPKAANKSLELDKEKVVLRTQIMR